MSEPVSGTLTRVLRERDGRWFVGVVAFDGAGESNVVGACCPVPRPGSRVEMQGAWKTTDFGREFAFTGIRVQPPGSVEGATLALESLPGIGRVTARELAAKLGPDPLKRIADDPTALDGVRGFTPAKAEALRAKVRGEMTERSVAQRLYAMGFRDGRIRAIRERFGDGLARMLDDNPYRLVAVSGISFRMVDDPMMRDGRFPAWSPFRAAAAVVHCLGEACESGHTWLPMGALDKAMSRLQLAYPVPPDAVEAGVSEAVRQGTVVRVERQTGIALAEVAEDEEEIAKRIAAMMEGKQ